MILMAVSSLKPFIASTLLLTNCSKKQTPPPPTSLQITLSDELGNKVSGASVVLYGSQNDWDNATNAISSQLSDANGVATFSNLATQKYYWFARKDCKNNISGSSTTQSPLAAKQTNTVIT